MICGVENSTNRYYVAVFSVDITFACHFMAPHPPHLHPYKSACGIGYASIKLYKMVGNSTSYPFKSWCMDRHRIMVNCMQPSVFLPKIQCFTSLKLLFLNNYDCAWKPSFLKSRHTFIMHISGWFLALLRVCVGLQFIVHKLHLH